MDTWRYDVPNWYPEEGTTFLGNGFIGGSIPLDGHGVNGARYAAAVAGFCVGPGEAAAQVPHWLNAPLALDGRPARVSPVEFRQVLDLRQGIITTTYHDAERSVRVETETFCHRARRNVTAYRMTVTALADLEVELSPRLDLARLTAIRPTAQTAREGEDGAVGWTLDYGDPENRAAQIVSVKCLTPAATDWLDSDDAIGRRVSARLGRGERCEIAVTVATATGAAPMGEAWRALAEAVAEGYDSLRRSHAAAMSLLSDAFSITAEDPYLERRARAAMFYLVTGFREDVVWGGAPTGLSSKSSWGGCIFWDTDFYMFPPLLLFHQALARNIVLFRYGTLKESMRAAAACGEEGARFAWQCRKSGRPLGHGFEDQRHISSDIAYCAWWYAHCAGDDAFMEERVAPMLREVARNWASRAVFDRERGRYGIPGVVPADEHVLDHHVGRPVDNSAMTNAYARWVLRKAAALAGGVAEGERRNWNEIADAMYLPRDEARGIYLEYDGYTGHPIKQADVGHMFFPLDLDADREEIRRNVYYYADRERETGLHIFHSPSAYGAALSRAGDVRGVARFLAQTDRNVVGPFEVPRESNYGGVPVLSSAGSFLTLLIYGVLGMDTFGETLRAHPCVPDEVGKIAVDGMSFRGRRYSITASPAEHALVEVA